MGDDRGKQIFLGVLMVAFAGVLYWQYGGGGGGAAERRAVEERRASNAADRLPELRSLPVELLQDDTEAYDPNGRNLFNFGKSAPSKAAEDANRKREERKRQIAEEAKRRAQQPPKKEPPEPRKPAEPPRPKPPEVDFKYIGYLGEREARVAVFSDGEEMALAREGQKVFERFLLVRIGFDEVEIGYADPSFANEKPKVITLGS